MILNVVQLRLMNFIRRIGRDEIYIKYVHQLVNVSLRELTSLRLVGSHMWYRCIYSPRTTLKRHSR